MDKSELHKELNELATSASSSFAMGSELHAGFTLGMIHERLRKIVKLLETEIDEERREREALKRAREKEQAEAEALRTQGKTLLRPFGGK